MYHLFSVESNSEQVTFPCNQKHDSKNDVEEPFILNTSGIF